MRRHRRRQPSTLVEVEGVVPTHLDDTNLRREAWSFALDQRAFGPRKLLVAFADADGTFRGMAVTERLESPGRELAIDPCIRFLGLGASVAVAFCDEPFIMGPPPADTAARFGLACASAASYGIRLVDWFACDDDALRSFRLALHPGEPWWPSDLPGG
jgi:hypothetical protein